MSELAKKLMVGEKIKEFAITNYGTIKKLAEALEIKPQSLDPYIHNESAPGMPLLYKLKCLGLDINYLLEETQPISKLPVSRQLYSFDPLLAPDLFMEMLEKYDKRITELEKKSQ